MPHDEQTEKKERRGSTRIFFIQNFFGEEAEKLAIKFTRSANIYDFVFLSLQSMILLLLLRMQKWRFDVTDGNFFPRLEVFYVIATLCGRMSRRQAIDL